MGRGIPSRIAITLLAGLLVTPAVGKGTASLRIPVRLGALTDLAVLSPFDPRAPELAARSPGVARGILSGTLSESGGLLRLVSWPSGSVGILALRGSVQWVTVAEGQIVPYHVRLSDLGAHQAEPTVSPQHAVAAASVMDGKLQILLDGDYEYGQLFGDLWDEWQLAVFALVGVIYQANLGVPIEVVQQHVWNTPAPLDGDVCPGTFFNQGILGQFRSAWEFSLDPAMQPTTADPRESAFLFSRKPPERSFATGCAYQSELETSFAYAMGWSLAHDVLLPNPLIPLLPIDVVVAAHEVGHNFSGLHERAMPTPGGPLDRPAPAAGPYPGCIMFETLMHPRVRCAAPLFSDAHGQDAMFESSGLAADGGNAPWMRAFAAARL